MSAGDGATNLGLDALRDRLSSLDRLNLEKTVEQSEGQLFGGSSHILMLVHPSYMWMNPTYLTNESNQPKEMGFIHHNTMGSCGDIIACSTPVG